MTQINPVVLIPGLGLRRTGAMPGSTLGAGPTAFDPIAAWAERMFGKFQWPSDCQRARAMEALRRDPNGNPLAGGLERHRDAGLLYAFTYDWHDGFPEVAKLLEESLTALSKEREGRRVDLVCHGTGGLLARYFLESGRFSVAQHLIGKLILLGVPNRGIPLAFTSLAGILAETDEPAGTLEYLLEKVPAFFQLLPPQGHPFVHLWEDPFLKVDLYRTPSLWECLMRSPDGKRALEGHSSVSGEILSTVAERNSRLHNALKSYYHYAWRRAFCFAGAGVGTLVSIEVEFNAGEYRARNMENAAAGGDGLVPWASALLNPGGSFHLLETDHAGLLEDRGFLSCLPRLLRADTFPRR